MCATFFSILASSLIIHAVLGCCWHHAHEAAECNESPLTLAQATGCEHDHGDSEDEHQPRGPFKSRSHCHGICSYLPAHKTQVDKDQSVALLDFAAEAGELARSQAVAQPFAAGNGAFGAPPPLRLHLYHQILLI